MKNRALLHPFLADAHAAGCPRDQVINFLRAGILLQKRQLEASAIARSCDELDGPLAIGYGGARGGGKSHWLLAQMGADDCQRVAGLKCLLLRKVGKANIENLEDLRKRLFRHLPHKMEAHRGILTFANGSRIVAGHFQSEKDIDAYLGLEYDVIGIEEATTLTSRKYQDILTCARSSKVLAHGHNADGHWAHGHGADGHGQRRHWRPRVYSTTNPGGVGHAWYRAAFIDPHRRGERGRTRFVPARVADNPFVNPEYARNLATLTGWQRSAWYDGSWDFAAGQFFSNFDPARHVVAFADPPVAGTWLAGFDYGFAHYTVFLLAHADDTGRITVIDEVAVRGVVPEMAAAQIHACLARHKLRASEVPVFTGADVCRRDAAGTTIAEQYRKLGIRLRPSSTDRVAGWAAVLQALGDPRQDVPATLFIHRRCEHLLTRLPAMQVDPNRSEDVLKVDCDDDGEGGDDSPDALRYLISAKKTGALILRL